MARDYEYVYRLVTVKPTLDGSGIVQNEVWAMYRLAGSTDEYQPVPGRHKDINCPASEVVEAIQSPGVKAKYLAMLERNLNTPVNPITGWGFAALEQLMDANDEVADAIAQFNAFLSGAGALLPYDF